MGDSKLCLLLLLSTSALAFAQNDDQPSCLLAKMYKALHKYEYQYEAESLNAINGASMLKNGPRASCTVEIEVPQTCSFILRTTGCSLSEVVNMDAEGNPVFGPAPSSADFAAEMEKYPLKFVVEGMYHVQLYPEDGETTTILNIKRGIISALAVPLLNQNKGRNMPTIHGKCKTYYKVNTREDTGTEITLNRDLSTCDRFVPMVDYTSPLALISGMHYPLTQLVKSHQTCNYRIDNEKKHIISGSCTENHILVPFSYKGEYGVTNVGKQELTLVQVSPHNDRVFDHSDIIKGLPMEAVEDKSAVQDKNAALELLRELATLPETEGERRAHLFYKLVTMVRGMKAETLSPAIPEALAISHVLTYQVLAQCGTPECSSAIMQVLRTFESSSLKADATVFAMGLISNPSALLIHDMLQMAEYNPSKPVMYALSNVVKRFYKAEGKLIPEIHSVAEFMAARLGDCSGDNDNTFLTLRVIGNMAPAVVPATPALRDAVIRCVNQPAASLAVQQAAIQVYRLTPVSEEDREVFMQVLLDGTSPVQKRIAAYLVLMKEPQRSELIQLTDALSSEQDMQFKSFVISHINNILTSTESETRELRMKIRSVLQANEIRPIMGFMFSRNYKIGSVEGNMIFEGTSYLPKEVMLEMTLKAFGFDIDMMEIGVESNGFEPTVDALFGENGFFPDTALKTMYFVSDNAPLGVNEILYNLLPALKRDRMKRQTSQNLMREIGHNLNKVMRDLESSQSPEAMFYLRLLGSELGYLTTNEMKRMAYALTIMTGSMFRMLQTDLIAALMTKSDNTIFAHYIFMDNEFFLPTLTGVPLRIALSGTFTPGIKGGINLARDMSEVTFMPSAGIEFVTQVGSHIPEYINSGLEMHTNIFHESGLNAKISLAHDQVKLTIPAPTSPTKLIKITNTLVAVTGSEVKTIPPMVMDKVDVSECTPVFTGMKYCTSLKYIDAFSQETAPYFPITGDSKFDVELYPTGEVTDYTATVAYELLREGEHAQQKVDSVTFLLRAEGAEPTEARAILKYNRKKNVITADIQIPDYDVEAGLRLGIANGNTRGKGTHSIYLDFINKNIPQLSLVGRANLKAMKEGMLQVQLLAPIVNADATVIAKMKYDEEVELELESKMKFMDVISKQKIEITYDDSKIEVEFKSDMKTETSILPRAEVFENYGSELLNMQVGQTDMKVGHIFKKFVEAKNNYMEKYGPEIPYIQNFRVPDMPEISLPETLFLNIETKAVYHFSNEHFTIAIPLPLGGKSSEELNFPQALTTPSMSLPEFGLEIVSMEIPIPEFVVPESLSISIPLFGKAEVLTLLRSNLYTMEASIAVGKDVLKTPSYSVELDVNGISPLEILSVRIKGLGLLTITDSVEAHLESSFAHKFIEASVNIVEVATITDKINLKSSSKIEALSVFGLNFALEHTVMTRLNTEEISADNNFVGMVIAGSTLAKTISTQSFTIFPFRPEAKIDSSIHFDSTVFQAQNTIAATLANAEFSVVSNTSVSDLSLENTFNAKVDVSKATLSITNKAAMQDIIANNANTLTITLSSLDFNSKAEATLSEYDSYTHDITIDLTPYSASANVNNNLKLLAAHFINEAQLKAELYKIDLTGSLKAMYGPDEIKHIYQLNYADMTANAKCTITGKVFGTHMSHDSELEIFGLAARINNNVHFNSQSMRFDHTMHCSIVPFDINLDAIFSADGDIAMYGKHSAQLYGKFLLKAQPLAVAASHECRASVTQMLDNSFSLETTFDNKMDTVLSLQEQKASYRMKSKMNDHAFNQDMSIYNTAERTGIEISGTILTNILATDSTNTQEFTISGFLKYDKNTDSHIIQLPLLGSVPVILESVKTCVVHIAEKLQSYINNEELMAILEDLPQYVSDFVSQLNIEGNAIQLKQYFTDFTENSISVKDMEDSLRDMMHGFEEGLTNVLFVIGIEVYRMYEMINTYDLPKLLIEEIQQMLDALDKKYSITDMVQYVIEDLISPYVRELTDMIPEEFLRNPEDYIMGLVQDSDTLVSIKKFFDNIRELILQFETDRKIEAVLEKAVELIKQFRIEETVRAAVKIVKEANMPTKIMQAFQCAINYLKSTEVSDIIQQLNMFIETIVQKLNSLNYNDFVDYTNHFVAECTAYQNELIRTLEIPQKLEATRDFVEFVVSHFKEHLREIKIAEMIESVLHIIYRDIVSICEMFSRFIKQNIPTQLDIPEFTILGHTVKPTTISLADIRLSIIKLLDFIINCDNIPDISAFLNDLTLSYSHFIPEITLPEITVVQISFPTIPHFPIEKLVKSLQVPENTLPAIPSDITVPCFGKLYGEIKFLTPIYTAKIEAGFQNSTENVMTPQFTGFLNSQATSPSFEILNYKLDYINRIAIPKMSRVVLVETINFKYLALGLEHEASLSLYGQSAQAQAKTAVKVTTTPYTANFVNTAFIAIEGGMSASLDTTYSHVVDLPDVNVKSEVTATQKSIARQDGLTFTLTVDNSGTGMVNTDDGNHKSNLQLSFTPSTVTLSFSGDTDSTILKMKQLITAEIGTFSYFKFNVRQEAEAPIIKNSNLVVTGQAKLYDMMVELKAYHDTELRGEVGGALSNRINIVVHPAEFTFELNNRGNVSIVIFKSLTANVELQNGYSVIFTPDSQKIITEALTRFNEYKVLYNFVLENNENVAGIFLGMAIAANLEFLTYPISIPEIDMPVFYIPAIDDLNLYEHTELNNILTITDQTVDVNAKVAYQKDQAAPLVHMKGVIEIPNVRFNSVYDFLQHVSEEVQAYMKISEGRLEIDLEFSLPQ